jgi:chondroitin 4-sulfotransferase 11
MPICHNRKFIFVHIPKNAGSSVEVTLGIYRKEFMVESKDSIVEDGISYSLQHLTATQLTEHELTKPFFKNYFKFSFVRNPYQRVLSEYFWLKQKKIDINKKSPENFSSWLDTYYSVIDKDHKLTQYQYLYDKENNLMVDFLGRVENFNQDFEILTKKFGRIIKPMQYNATRQKKDADHSLYLTDSNKEKIYNLFKIDFDTFGYEK